MPWNPYGCYEAKPKVWFIQALVVRKNGQLKEYKELFEPFQITRKELEELLKMEDFEALEFWPFVD